MTINATVTFGRPVSCIDGQHQLAMMATTGMVSCMRCQFWRQMTPEEFAHWNSSFEERKPPKPPSQGEGGSGDE